MDILLIEEESMIIRKAEVADADGIARVHDDSWWTTSKGVLYDQCPGTHSHEKRTMMWKYILSGEFSEIYERLIVYVVENGKGEIIGFVYGGKKWKHNKVYIGELAGIYLLKEYHNQGIGRKMVATFAQELLSLDIERMMLCDHAKNSSRLFYEKLGALKLGESNIIIGDKEYNLIDYGWEDISVILNDRTLAAERMESHD